MTVNATFLHFIGFIFIFLTLFVLFYFILSRVLSPFGGTVTIFIIFTTLFSLPLVFPFLPFQVCFLTYVRTTQLVVLLSLNFLPPSSLETSV